MHEQNTLGALSLNWLSHWELWFTDEVCMESHEMRIGVIFGTVLQVRIQHDLFYEEVLKTVRML